MEDPNQGDIENYENYSGEELQSLADSTQKAETLNLQVKLERLRMMIGALEGAKMGQLESIEYLQKTVRDLDRQLEAFKTERKEVMQKIDSETEGSPFDK